MKIVFIRSAGIYEDSRATKELFAFLKKGYEIEVLGWNRDGQAKIKCEEVFSDYRDSIRFHFYNGRTGSKKLEKISCRLQWSRWIKQTLMNISNVSIVHACDFDTASAIFNYCKKQGIPYVYDIYDYYIAAHPVPRVLRRIIEQIDMSAINSSALTIICTEERKKQIEKANPIRTIVIHNSPEVEYVSEEDLEYDYVYCGAMGRGRLIEEICDGYILHNEYKFAFAGNGINQPYVKQLSKKYDNFVYFGAIPYSEVLKIESKSLIISAIYDPSIENHKLCAPNKFYEALALAKPIIVCRGTGLDVVVNEKQIGFVIDYSADQFYKVIDYAVKHQDECIEMGNRARALYESSYRWSKMEKLLLKSYDEILK